LIDVAHFPFVHIFYNCDLDFSSVRWSLSALLCTGLSTQGVPLWCDYPISDSRTSLGEVSGLVSNPT